VVLDFLVIFTWSLYIETKGDSIAGKGILVRGIQKPHEWSGSSSILILGVVVVFFLNTLSFLEVMWSFQLNACEWPLLVVWLKGKKQAQRNVTI